MFFTSDFSVDNWDDLGNQSSNGGDNYSSTSITGGKLRIESNSGAGEAGGAVAITEMSAGLGTSWNIRFNFTTGSSMTKNGNNLLYIGVTSDSSYTSSQGANNQNGDACMFRWHMDDDILRNRTWDDETTVGNCANCQDFTWADNTTFYWELTYDNSTFSCLQFPNSDYATPVTTATTVSQSGLTGMNYLLVGMEYGNGTGVWTIDINQIKVANDTIVAC